MFFQLQLLYQSPPLFSVTLRFLLFAFESLQAAGGFTKLSLGIKEFLYAHENSATTRGGSSAESPRRIIDISLKCNRLYAPDLTGECNEFRRFCVVTNKSISEDEVHRIRDIARVANKGKCEADLISCKILCSLQFLPMGMST